MKLNIKQARELAGLTQKDLAEKLGVAASTFNGYEKGQHDPKSDVLIAISNICGVSTDFLLGLTDYPMRHNQAFSDPGEAELVQIYHTLNAEGKHDLLKHGRMMVKAGDYTPDDEIVADEKREMAIS